MKDYLRERAQTLKMRCLHAYGGRCACCGIDHTEFLCIDHIDGGGNKQRKELGGGSSRLHPWLVKNNFPLATRSSVLTATQERSVDYVLGPDV